VLIPALHSGAGLVLGRPAGGGRGKADLIIT
jgi:hypothetical protein